MQKESRFCEEDKAGKGMEIVLESGGGRRRGRAGQWWRGSDSLNCPVPSQSSASKRFIINCQTAVLISSAPQWKIDFAEQPPHPPHRTLGPTSRDVAWRDGLREDYVPDTRLGEVS